MEKTDTRRLLEGYYDGLLTRNGWDQLLSDDVLLTGTVAKESRGRQEYSNNNFFKMVRGLRVKEMLVEGDRGFALVHYDLVSPRGRTFSSDVAELWKTNDHRLASVAIYFDTAAFASAMAQG